jgi:NADH:ubiquinone oxidoreductase subunit F (NADH-binding)
MKNWIKRLFGESTCDHDWEIVEDVSVDTILGRMKGVSGIRPGSCYVEYKGETMYLDTEKFKFWSTQKVCLKCGECRNGVADRQMQILTHLEAEYIQLRDYMSRRKLARQMWKNCK